MGEAREGAGRAHSQREAHSLNRVMLVLGNCITLICFLGSPGLNSLGLVPGHTLSWPGTPLLQPLPTPPASLWEVVQGRRGGGPAAGAG